MTRAVPPILTRAAFTDPRTGMLTREGALVLDALRSALGGNSATVTPVEPLGALLPVAAFLTPSDGLGPVAPSVGVSPDLSPVAAIGPGSLP